MGDRVIIVVTDGEEIAPAAIYGHWIGHEAPSIIEQAGKANLLRVEDVNYSAARLCGFFHEQDSRSATGLGLISPPANLEPATLAAYSHGDGGVIVVNVKSGEISYFGGYHARRLAEQPDEDQQDEGDEEEAPPPTKVDLYRG